MITVWADHRISRQAEGPNVYSAVFGATPTNVSGAFDRGSRFLVVYPNPTNPSTRADFDVHTKANVNLSIYDAAGRFVRRLISQPAATPGRYSEQWDGRDQNGHRVASGSYFFRLKIGNEVRHQRIVLLK